MKKTLLTATCVLMTTALMGCTTNTANIYYIETSAIPAPKHQAMPAPHTGKAAEKPCDKKKKELVTETVYFSNDSAVVSPMGVEKIKGLLKKAKDGGNHDGYMYYVSGYANSVGNPNYNEGLSKRRAEAVKKIMTDNGIAKWRIKDKAFGEMNPAVPTTNAEWKSLNRRVVIGFEPAQAK